MKVVAEVVIIPLGEGASVSKYIKKAYDIFKKYNLKVELTAMGTILEGDMKEILKAYYEAHKKVLEDVDRVVSQIRIDERKDKENSIERKIKSVLEK
ncbi:MTH1187 family thiamine-binding protein [Methanocaldococcus indicus]|uniref:MTH1187 family thiamine-binding protein n=1 Tax=Methanocaldococcus indicus TaxID=213231 RepID=UPI003C6DA0F9